jgi:uncharacterized repeat protein (TIGR01451 family)
MLSCTPRDLGPGQSFTVQISSATSAASCKAYPNTATATATNHAQVQASETITVLCPDLVITKTADATSVAAGQPIGFTITVKNNGAGAATGVTITDPLPGNTGLSWTISPAASGCSISTGTLTCNVGVLAAGQSSSVHVTSPTTTSSCATINNTATVTATNDDGGSASASVTVRCPVGGRLTPTATTCQDFASGTAADLNEILYGVKGGKINNVAPGVLFYYTTFTAPSTGSFVVQIVQTKNNSNMPFMGVQQSQVTLYNSGCGVISRSGSVSSGTITVNVTGATKGQVFIIGVKYDPGSVTGTSVSNPLPTVHYDFATQIGGTTVDKDADGLNLKPKP